MDRDTFIIVLAGLLAGKQTAHEIYWWAAEVYPNIYPAKASIFVMLDELRTAGMVEAEPSTGEGKSHKVNTVWTLNRQWPSVSIDIR